MAVTLGINPITWTNDDMPELGGDIPLEICLVGSTRGGLRRHRDGRQVSARPRRVLRPILDRHGLRLVSGWYSAQLARAIRRRGDRGGRRPSRASRRDGLHGDGLRRRPRQHRRRPGRAAVAPAGLGRRGMAGVLRAGQRVARASASARRPAGVPPSHGNGGPDRGGNRPADGETDRDVGLLLDTGHSLFAGGDPVAVARRHARAHRPCPLQGHARATC